MKRGALAGVCCVLAVLGLALCRQRFRAPVPPLAPSALPEEGRAASARERFLAAHPGEKPLNWAIGDVAGRFHRARPMGRFVLHENDCSDYAECIIDEALGVGARFKRGSQKHLIGERAGAFEYWYWQPGLAVQPGDLVSVAHSPWYAPQEGSIGHVGVIGSDGMIYDFAKLRRWKSARYGRHPFAWFVRHSTGPREVIIGRLKPEYRYRIDPIPHL